MRYLSIREVLEIHNQILQLSGTLGGVRDLGALESAVAQPRMTFGAEDLYSTLVEKASALGFSIIQNHPFIDGNKRTGHAAMETFLVLNNAVIDATTDEQVDIVLAIASGMMKKDQFTEWLENHVTTC